MSIYNDTYSIQMTLYNKFQKRYFDPKMRAFLNSSQNYSRCLSIILDTDRHLECALFMTSLIFLNQNFSQEKFHKALIDRVRKKILKIFKIVVLGGLIF